MSGSADRPPAADASDGDITLRAATPADAEAIAGHNVALAAESEALQLDAAVVRAGVDRALSGSVGMRYWVAEREGAVVGNVAVTVEWSDWRNGMWWWLQSVYVVPAARRKGVLRRLIRAVREAAQQDDGVAGLRLYVEKDNTNAIVAYERLGFAETPYRVFEAY